MHQTNLIKLLSVNVCVVKYGLIQDTLPFIVNLMQFSFVNVHTNDLGQYGMRLAELNLLFN